MVALLSQSASNMAMSAEPGTEAPPPVHEAGSADAQLAVSLVFPPADPTQYLLAAKASWGNSNKVNRTPPPNAKIARRANRNCLKFNFKQWPANKVSLLGIFIHCNTIGGAGNPLYCTEIIQPTTTSLGVVVGVAFDESVY